MTPKQLESQTRRSVRKWLFNRGSVILEESPDCGKTWHQFIGYSVGLHYRVVKKDK